MSSQSFADQAANNSPKLWVTVSLLWGTVFYITSIYAFILVPDFIAAAPHFEPVFFDTLKVYPLYVVFLLMVAFGGYGFNRIFDPTGEKRKARQEKVARGKTETIFVSFAGSIATSFFFTMLAAIAFILGNMAYGTGYEFTVMQVFYASIGNIAAGLTGSLLVGIIFLILKAMGRFPTSQFSS